MSQPVYSGLQFHSAYRTPLLSMSNAVLIPTTPSNNIMRSSQSKRHQTPLVSSSAVSLDASRGDLVIEHHGVHTEVVGAQGWVTNVEMTSCIAQIRSFAKGLEFIS
jgi:hypothetical protein